MTQTFAIVGAGQAGAWIARTLRSEGFAGRILLIGAEAHMPYERPPLSKAELLDETAPDAATLLSAGRAQELDIDVWLSTRVVAIDRTRQCVRCADGRQVDYDRLFLAMGSQPRWPAWAPRSSPRIHRLRTRDDARRLRHALAGARSLLVVGGGWIGLEVAAGARKLGLSVEIVEIADRLCGRSLPAPLSAWLAELHGGQGVTLSMGCSVTMAIEHEDGVVLTLDDGSSVEGDQLLIGIGNVPDVALAAAAGLDIANGVAVDATGRTSDPAIYAAGDIASFHCALAGPATRRESWANAQNQAIVAAKAALGQDVRYEETAWLWSDQYGRNIQMLGVPERARSLALRPGRTEGSGCWLALDAGNIPIGAVAIDAGRDIRAARKLIALKAPIAMNDWQGESDRREPVR